MIALEETQERLHAEQRSYDRKLTSITSEYERNLNGLINHTGMSGLLQAAIRRTDDAGTTVGTDSPADGSSAGGEAAVAAAADVASTVGGGGGGVANTTQDVMAKVLHERWLSEREKAKTLEARLSDAEARMGDMDEVRFEDWVMTRQGDMREGRGGKGREGKGRKNYECETSNGKVNGEERSTNNVYAKARMLDHKTALTCSCARLPV